MSLDQSNGEDALYMPPAALTVEAYRQFRLECREHLRQIAREEDFEHIRPLNAPRSKLYSPTTYKVGVNILGKSPDLPDTGRRNLEAGHLETILIVEAPFIDDSDYSKGMDISQTSHGLRLVIGNDLGKYDFFTQRMKFCLESNICYLGFHLKQGDYRNFTKMAMGMINRHVGELKQLQSKK